MITDITVPNSPKITQKSNSSFPFMSAAGLIGPNLVNMQKVLG